MTRSGVHDARAVFHRDVVGVDEDTLLAVVAEDRLLVLVAEKLGSSSAPTFNDLRVIPTEFLDKFLDERLGHNVGAPIVLDGNVGLVGMQDHGIVGRKRPRSRRPNSDVELSFPSLEAGGDRRHLEAYEDGGRNLVAVLDLGLCEGGLAVAAPMDGLTATIDGAVEVHLLEHLDVSRLVVGDVRKVRMLPVGVHAETLEAVALDAYVLFGPIAA